MRRLELRALWWVLAIAVLGGCAGTRESAAPAVDQAAIGAAVDSVSGAFMAAIAAKDTAGLVNLYATDAQLLPPNAMRADGSDAIRQVWAGFLVMPDLTIRLTSTSKQVSDDGSMAVDVGSYELGARDAQGRPIHDVGKYVTVLRKIGGEWKIVVDTWNSDSPMPPL